MRRSPLALLSLLLMSTPQALATVRLGDVLPPHPWATVTAAQAATPPEASSTPAEEPRSLVVLYSHDCGDLSGLWPALLHSGLPIHAVNAEDVASPAPDGLDVWRGPQATQFARALRVSVYPTVLLVRGERVLNAWQGELGKVEGEW